MNKLYVSNTFDVGKERRIVMRIKSLIVACVALLASPASAGLGVSIYQIANIGGDPNFANVDSNASSPLSPISLSYANSWGSGAATADWGVLKTRAESLPAFGGVVSRYDLASANFSDVYTFSGTQPTLLVDFRVLVEGSVTNARLGGTSSRPFGTQRQRIAISSDAIKPDDEAFRTFINGTLVRDIQVGCFDGMCAINEGYSFTSDINFMIDRVFTLEVPTGVPVVIGIGTNSVVEWGGQLAPAIIDASSTTLLGGISGQA